MLTALIFLLCFPATGFTEDVSITDVTIKWIERGGGLSQFRAKITVTNNTEKTCSVNGALIFYDGGGFEIRRDSFVGTMEAGETRVFQEGGLFNPRELEELDFYEADIDRPSCWPR